MTPKNDGGSSHYYEIPPNAKELQDLIEHRKMNFSQGNIFKAIYRMGEKEGVSDEYNIRKVLFFAERELKRIQNEQRNSV